MGTPQGKESVPMDVLSFIDVQYKVTTNFTKAIKVKGIMKAVQVTLITLRMQQNFMLSKASSLLKKM